MEQGVKGNISFFDNLYEQIPREVDLHAVLFAIKNGEYQTSIEKCRLAIREYDFEAYKKLKVQLAAVTFSGRFYPKRRKDFLVSYSNFIILDFDKIERVDMFERLIKEDPFVYSAWLSPSGCGYKALVRVSCTKVEHPFAFDALVEYFAEKYNFQVDISGSDITRLCLVSYDPQLYLNQKSLIWAKLKNTTIETIKEKPISYQLLREDKEPSKEKKLLKKIIKFLKHRNKSITDNYDKWYKVAFALANTFSYNFGHEYFLELCRLDGSKHDEEKSSYIFDYCYRNNKNKINFSTILFYAKELGFINSGI